MSDLRDTAADRRAQQTNQDLVDDERSEQIRILRPGHQVEQARDRVDDVVGRASDIQPTIVRRLGDAARVDPRGELSHPRGIQIQREAEIRILPTGASHLAGDRQIHGEDEQVRGIVFEHFTAKHHDLGTLRRDAQGGAQRGVGGLGRHPREAYGIGAREPELKRSVVRGVRRDPIGESSERQCAGRCERRVLAGSRGRPRESVDAAAGAGLRPLRVSKTSRVWTGLPRRCRHHSNGTSKRGRDACRNLRLECVIALDSWRNRQETAWRGPVR